MILRWMFFVATISTTSMAWTARESHGIQPLPFKCISSDGKSEISFQSEQRVFTAAVYTVKGKTPVRLNCRDWLKKEKLSPTPIMTAQCGGFKGAKWRIDFWETKTTGFANVFAMADGGKESLIQKLDCH